jgi:hypothetical protein
MSHIIKTWRGWMNKAKVEAEKAFKKTEGKMESDITLEDMAKQIKELDSQLADMKKDYRERKLLGLRSAMDARKSAEEAVREELKALGVAHRSYAWSSADPFNLYTKWY